MTKLNKKRVLKYLFLVIGLIAIIWAASLISWTKKDVPTNPFQTFDHSFNLEIPRLNIQAPIIADVSGENKIEYFKALENGVAHFKGTKKPGEGGMIFIFGHSSYLPDSLGNYKEIFLNLEKIKIDDEIVIWYKEKEYKYKVLETKIVDPKDLSVLEPTKTEQLNLMTCVPPGTKEKRLIVVAKPF